MDRYDIAMYVALLIGALFIFGIGFINGSPNELENGCIVYENKVYCEEMSKGQ